MIAKQRSFGLMKVTRLSNSPNEGSVLSDRAVRLIQAALALYLIPVLLVVLVMGGVGILVLGMGRLITGPVRGSVG